MKNYLLFFTSELGFSQSRLDTDFDGINDVVDLNDDVDLDDDNDEILDVKEGRHFGRSNGFRSDYINGSWIGAKFYTK